MTTVLPTYKRYINTIAVIASLGGFLFGYDTAVISGTIKYVTLQFGLDAVHQGWYVSSALVGSILGVSVSGILSDKYGRKKILILAAVLFSISAVGCVFADGFADLVVYRLIAGLGIGVASMLSPLYISEISPSRQRGRLVALYQFAITVGILCSYFSNAWLLHISASTLMQRTTGHMHTIMVDEIWRIMLGCSVLPAAGFLILLFLVPESPRWLVIKGKQTKAKSILGRMMPANQAEHEVHEIAAMSQQESPGLRIIFRGGFKTALLIGVSLAVLTQVSGINAIIYYGPGILEKAGLPTDAALGGQVVIGLVNVFFTLIAIWKIDSLGRRPLLLAGVCGIIISLLAIGILFHIHSSNPYLLLSCILFFIACFAFSYGPVIWVLLAEIFPTHIRGKAMSIATFALWIGTALVGQLTPILLETWGPAETFWLFALLTCPALWIGLRILPETKGRSLEEIEQFWLNKR